MERRINRLKKTSKPCKLDCDKCARISDSDKIISTTGEGFKIPNYNNCRQHSVVYSISCKKCETVVYVGETERQLNERMTEHLRDIKLQRDKPINGHFLKKDHSEEDAVFSISQQIKSGCKTERLMYESTWIQKLRTHRPAGCNVKDSRYQLTLI